MTPHETLLALERKGLRHVLEIALERFKRTGELGRVSMKLKGTDLEVLRRLTEQKSRVLDLRLLDAALRSSIYALSLEAVLTALNGAPIVVRRDVKSRFETGYAALLERVTNLEWRETLMTKSASANVLKRALKENTDDLKLTLEYVQTALEQLGTRKPILASQVTGDAHGFDKDRLAGKLLDAAITDLNLEPPMRDGVSSSVLVANLRGTPWLDALQHRAVWLPWREVQNLETVKTVSGRVLIVENPSVFEALLETNTLETLICTSGQPSAATMLLLEKFESGTEFWVSCDFDVGGLRIASRLQKQFSRSFRTWHFDAISFRIALERKQSFKLEAPLQSFATYFPELVATMLETGLGAHHEAILPELLHDATTSARVG